MIDWILKRVKPLIELIGKIHIPFSRKKITGIHLAHAMGILEPGDIILTTTYGEASNLINSGEYKHTAIFIGGDNLTYVVEAIGKGVVKTDLPSFLLSKDKFCILKNRHFTRNEKLEFAGGVCMRLGEKYDYLFFIDYKGPTYCSELAYTEAMKVRPEMNLKHDIVKGRAIVRPMHFRLDAHNWELAYES